jgi:hypothetical protein
MVGLGDLRHALNHVRDKFEHLISVGNGGRTPTSDSGLGGVLWDVLQRMQDTLTQQRKFRPAVAHPFDQFQLVHLPFHEAIVLRKRESCYDRCFVSFNTSHKAQ